ncbi:MAG: hypothetical protein ACR2JX_03575 [Mycobacteriales bacterium]
MPVESGKESNLRPEMNKPEMAEEYWRRADRNQKTLQSKLQQLREALGPVSQETLECILFDNLMPEVTRRTLRSARTNPVLHIKLGHEYRLDGVAIAAHGRHDQAQTLHIYLGTTPEDEDGVTWPDNPVSGDSTHATLHCYGDCDPAALYELIAQGRENLTRITLIPTDSTTTNTPSGGYVETALAVIRDCAAARIAGITVRTDHVCSDTERTRLREAANKAAPTATKPRRRPLLARFINRIPRGKFATSASD